MGKLPLSKITCNQGIITHFQFSDLFFWKRKREVNEWLLYLITKITPLFNDSYLVEGNPINPKNKIMAEKESGIEKLLKKITDKASELTTLEIITIVGSPEFKKVGGDVKPVIQTGTDQKAIVTSINLIQGDITTQMSEEFVTGEYQSLREYHANREKEGFEIIDKNIKAIKSLVDLVFHIDGKPELKNKSSETPTPS